MGGGSGPVAALPLDLQRRQSRAAVRYADAQVRCERSGRLVVWSRMLTRYRRSRIRGGSADDAAPILHRLRTRIVEGTLPSTPPKKMYTARATDRHVCTVCSSPLRLDQVEYESDTENQILHLHPRCFELWREVDGQSTVSATSRTVLVVDDRPDARYTIVRGLAAAGFDVRQVGTGGDALRLACLPIHLIVLELMLPDMDGVELLRRLK